MKNVYISQNPFVCDSLTHLRDKNTSIETFRHYSDQLCELLFSEAIKGLTFKQTTIDTPLAKIESEKFAEEIMIVPVLRSGTCMLFGALKLLPKAKVGFVGMVRDEKTAIASEYYWKMPHISQDTVVMVTDPMLATGGSIAHLLERVAKANPKEIRIVCVLVAPEGIETIQNKYPNIKIFTAAVDSHLNAKKYIVPGLGDYGDRYFGTEI